MQGGAISWQNVQFVKRAFISETMSAILIDDLTEYGNQTLSVSAARSMEYHRSYMFVLPALDPVKLREPSASCNRHACGGYFLQHEEDENSR